MRKVLVTGGAGYIGNMIATLLLQQGCKVRVVDLLWFKKDIPLIHADNPNYEFIKGDICDGSIRQRMLEDVDCIVHAAAVVGEPASKKFPAMTKKINYEASIELIKMTQHLGDKDFIYISTCSNYGIADGFANEETPLKALSLYARTKVGVERYLLDEVKNINWVICRLSTVYGVSSRMRFDLTVNDFVMNAYKNRYLDIFLPLSYRPYIHVYDVARVIVGMVGNFERIKNNIFNVGFNGENYQKIQIAEIVKKFLPETKIEIVKRGADLRDYQVDFSKLQRSLNIKNMFTVEKGVGEVLKLLKDQTIQDPYGSCYYNTMPDLEREDKWLKV